jgi:hypothetical protein
MTITAHLGILFCQLPQPQGNHTQPIALLLVYVIFQLYIGLELYFVAVNSHTTMDCVEQTTHYSVG